MAEIVNLRLVRKARKRDQAAQASDANRAKFGRTKGEKMQQQAETTRLDALLDGARREPD